MSQRIFLRHEFQIAVPSGRSRYLLPFYISFPRAIGVVYRHQSQQTFAEVGDNLRINGCTSCVTGRCDKNENKCAKIWWTLAVELAERVPQAESTT